MAKEKSSKQSSSKPSKNPGLESGELMGLGVQVSRRHYDGVQECAKRERRTKRAIVEAALELYFKQTGLKFEQESE